MKVTVNIPSETIDDLVVQVLKDYHKLCMVPNKIDNSDEVIPPDQELLEALERVLYDFLTEKEYDAWYKESYNRKTK